MLSDFGSVMVITNRLGTIRRAAVLKGKNRSFHPGP